MDLSIVISLYNEEESLRELVNWITKAISSSHLRDKEYEIVMVNDGSTDGSWKEIETLAKEDNHIRAISFRRNYGKSAALYEGFKAAQGEVVVTMDADLQDPPALLKEMYEAITKEGYDAVGTRRTTRKGEPVIRSFFAKLFYKLIDDLRRSSIGTAGK